MMKNERDRAPLAPARDRMMRGRAELVLMAVCEDCKIVMYPNKVADHFQKTGHGTYNQKFVPRKDYATR